MRTIYRDVESLCEAGVPIHMERGPLGGIVLADDYRRALAEFTADELRSLFTSGPGPFADLGFASSTPALQKLAGALSAAQRRSIETSRGRFFLDHNKWSRGEQPTEILQRLREASERDRCVRLRYRDRSGAATERVIDPLGLVAKAGVWYLIARETGKGYRTFRAQRVDAVSATGQAFTRPPDFDLQTYWNASVLAVEQRDDKTYPVVVRVNRAAAGRLTAFWNVVSERVDGETATLAIAFPARDVAIVQLMILAHDVTIVEPPDLAEAIVAHARAAIAHFEARRGADRGASRRA